MLRFPFWRSYSGCERLGLLVGGHINVKSICWGILIGVPPLLRPPYTDLVDYSVFLVQALQECFGKYIGGFHRNSANGSNEDNTWG